MAKQKPRTLSGFMELLPQRQVQFDRMVETLRQQNLPAEVFEARKKQLLHQFSLQRFAFRLRSPLEQGLSQATASSKQSKRLHFNYVMVGRLRFCPCR